MRLFKVDKATIQLVEFHLKVIFCLLTRPKCDLGKFVKAMFQGLTCNFELIFFLMISPKFNFGKVEKDMFQMGARHWEFLLTCSKCDLGEV